MNASAAVLVAALVAAVPAPSLGAASPPARATAPDPRAWPAVYEPTTMIATELLARAQQADGTLGQGRHTARIRWSFRDGGLEGTEREVRSGDDYRIDSTIGMFVTASGRLHNQRWTTNENGYTVVKRGLPKRTEANERALQRLDPSDDVKVLGRLRQPSDVYVLRVAPADGRPELRFYDAAMFRLVRRETAYLNALVVTSYDDFRTANGVTLAYRMTLSDGRPQNDEVWDIENLKIDVPVAPAELEIPGQRRIALSFPDGVDRVRLPARIDGRGHAIVRLTINGRGLDFQLDSGAAGIVLNRDVARELGLTIHGRWSNTVAGTFTTGRVVVPKLEIGALVMNDVVVYALPFAEENDWETRIVGLLGYDFIAGCVLKIDYEHGTVDAIRPRSFEPPADAIALDAILDDHVPVVWLRVNDVLGERFVLDTGADDVVIFSGFAAKHPAAVDDHSPRKVLSRSFPVVQLRGVGGTLRVRPIMIAQMQFGNVRFKDYLALIMSGEQPAFEGEDLDGLVGVPTLRTFDLYLDYAHSRVVLLSNGRTKKIVPPKPPS